MIACVYPVSYITYILNTNEKRRLISFSHSRPFSSENEYDGNGCLFMEEFFFRLPCRAALSMAATSVWLCECVRAILSICIRTHTEVCSGE